MTTYIQQKQNEAREKFGKPTNKQGYLHLTNEEIDTLIENLIQDTLKQIEGVLGEEKYFPENYGQNMLNWAEGHNTLHTKVTKGLLELGK